MSEPIESPATDATQQADAPAQEVDTDWKAEARKWEQRAKENTAKLKEAAPKLSEYERMVEAQKTTEQRQSEELSRWQTEAERWRTASVGHRIEALAAKEFADPSDAVTALADPGKFLDAGGQINDEAIRAELDAVLARKPHWRRASGDSAPETPRLPAVNPNQGAGGAAPPGDPAAQLASIFRDQLNRS